MTHARLSAYSVSVALLVGENLQPVVCHEKRVLPLGGRHAVAGRDRPTILTAEVDFAASHVDHWLDGEDHARDEQHSRARLAVVGNLWILVELETDAMTA